MKFFEIVGSDGVSVGIINAERIQLVILDNDTKKYHIYYIDDEEIITIITFEQYEQLREAMLDEKIK